MRIDRAFRIARNHHLQLPQESIVSFTRRAARNQHTIYSKRSDANRPGLRNRTRSPLPSTARTDRFIYASNRTRSTIHLLKQMRRESVGPLDSHEITTPVYARIDRRGGEGGGNLKGGVGSLLRRGERRAVGGERDPEKLRRRRKRGDAHRAAIYILGLCWASGLGLRL